MPRSLTASGVLLPLITALPPTTWGLYQDGLLPPARGGEVLLAGGALGSFGGGPVEGGGGGLLVGAGLGRDLSLHGHLGSTATSGSYGVEARLGTAMGPEAPLAFVFIMGGGATFDWSQVSPVPGAHVGALASYTLGEVRPYVGARWNPLLPDWKVEATYTHVTGGLSWSPEPWRDHHLRLGAEASWIGGDAWRAVSECWTAGLYGGVQWGRRRR